MKTCCQSIFVKLLQVSLTSLGTVSDEERGKEQESEPRPFPPSQDSLDEEFHENLIYGGIFSKLSSSEQSMKPVSDEKNNFCVGHIWFGVELTRSNGCRYC